MKSTLFKNAHIIFQTGIKKGEVLVADGKIKSICTDGKISERADRVIDVQNKFLSPGFIDIHTHGGGGYDFMDGDIDSIYEACKTHMNYGTTSILPTTITSTKESLIDFVHLFNQVILKKEGLPSILGLHLEGPYFAHSQAGAQDPQHLRNPEPDEYKKVLEISDRIVRWSFAIELEGSDKFLSTLRQHNVITSLAHSDATCQETFKAFENGVQCMTHFYSAMSTVKRVNAMRVAGAIEAGYLLDDMFVEVIADGKHLPKELLQLIYKVKGADKICLVTDSMRGAGMPEGEYVLGNKDTGMTIIVEDDVAKLMDRSSFAGSVATANRLVRVFRNATDAPLYQVVNMMTINPAKLLKLDTEIGSIALDKNADMIIFDDDINVELVMVNGTIVKE